MAIKLYDAIPSANSEKNGDKSNLTELFPRVADIRRRGNARDNSH